MAAGTLYPTKRGWTATVKNGRNEMGLTLNVSVSLCWLTGHNVCRYSKRPMVTVSPDPMGKPDMSLLGITAECPAPSYFPPPAARARLSPTPV